MVGTSTRVRGSAAFAIGAAAAVLGAGCGAIIGEEPLETVRIAADLQLTGEGSALGEVYQEALQLRVDHVNEQGVLGNRRLELEVHDNRSDRATAASNLGELARDPEIAAIISGGCGECTVDAAEVLTDARVPTISLASAKALVEPPEDRPYLFKLGPSADHTARVLANELVSLEAETVAVLASDDLYGGEALDEIETAVTRAGVEVVTAVALDGSEESLTEAVTSVVEYRPAPEYDSQGFPTTAPTSEQDVGPDAVVMSLPGSAASEVAIALREAEYEGPFLLDAPAADELFLSGPAAVALAGARMVFTETLVIDEVIASSPAKATRQNWFNEYTARQGTYHAHSSFAADAVEVIAHAVSEVSEVDRASLHTALQNTQLEGVSGPVRIRLESHAGLSSQALTVLVAQGDRWRLAS